VKIERRPNRSARKPRKNVPTNNPAKVAATNAPIPEKPKNACVVVLNSSLRLRPGAIYPVRNRS
jgi:hypothetical protein